MSERLQSPENGCSTRKDMSNLDLSGVRQRTCPLRPWSRVVSQPPGVPSSEPRPALIPAMIIPANVTMPRARTNVSEKNFHRR